MTSEALPGLCRRLECALTDLDEWNRLDAAGYRVSMRRSVRRYGWFLAIGGAVSAIAGFAAPSLALAAIGLVLAGAGAWNVWRPSVEGLVVDGAAVILTGLLQCVAWQWMENTPAANPAKWIITGIIQIVWGVRRIALYPTARFAVNDSAAIARLEAIVRDLAKRKAKSEPSVVEFTTGRIRRHRNRLGLYADGVVGLLEHQVVRLEKRSDIWIEARGTTLLGRSVKVRVQMGDLQLIGSMPAEHLERFERWKQGAAPPLQMAA
jgi:hypothetical protein